MTSARTSGAGVRVDPHWTYRGLRAVVLENRLLRVIVLPELGGKVWSLVHKPKDLELLWHNPRVPPRPVGFGSVYDDVFFGGWDELYPNDEPEVLAGEAVPDHGELWTLPWSWSVGADADRAWVRLEVSTPVTASRISKTLTMTADSTRLETSYRLTNVGLTAQPFLWKSHVAVRLHADSTVDLGADTLLVHEFGNPRARPVNGLVSWPTLDDGDRQHDLRTLPAADSGHSEFLISTSMLEGFAAVDHPGRGVSLRLDFDLASLPSIWTFASYGGWRGHHLLILEPCTGYPLSVVDGVAAGTHQVLAPGEVRAWSLTASVGTTVPTVSAP